MADSSPLVATHLQVELGFDVSFVQVQLGHAMLVDHKRKS